MINLEVRLKLDSKLEFPDYVQVNDEEEREREGYYWVNISVEDSDYDALGDFLLTNQDELISLKFINN